MLGKINALRSQCFSTRGLIELCFLGLITCVCVWRSFGVHAAQGPKPTVEPVTVTWVENQFGPNGQLASTLEHRFARFSDRSYRNTTINLFPKRYEDVTEIVNTSAGTWVELDPLTHSSVTVRRSPSATLKLVTDQYDSQCPSGIDVSNLPNGPTILGFATRFHREQMDSMWLSERWIVPELSCLPVKIISSNISAGADSTVRSHSSHNEEIATDLQRGEPSRSLLIIPAAYRERRPEVVEQMHKLISGGVPFFGPQVLKILQRDYDSKP